MSGSHDWDGSADIVVFSLSILLNAPGFWCWLSLTGTVISDRRLLRSCRLRSVCLDGFLRGDKGFRAFAFSNGRSFPANPTMVEAFGRKEFGLRSDERGFASMAVWQRVERRSAAKPILVLISII